MALRDIVNNIKERLTHREVEVYGDDETRDKYLRSLRREKRMQMEQEEKKILKAQIAAYKKRQREEHLWGTRGGNLLRSKNSLPKRQNSRMRWL